MVLKKNLLIAKNPDKGSDTDGIIGFARIVATLLVSCLKKGQSFT